MVGDEKQSQDLVNSLSEQYQTAPDQLWESNIFGKSVFEMVNDGLTTKLRRMSDDVRVKFRGLPGPGGQRRGHRDDLYHLLMEKLPSNSDVLRI